MSETVQFDLVSPEKLVKYGLTVGDVVEAVLLDADTPEALEKLRRG